MSTLKMPRLQFPLVEAKIRRTNLGNQIWDQIRKRFVALTPEEWVRQHVVEFLIREKQVPASLIAVEMGLKFNGMLRRADVVVYNTLGNPIFMIECKEPRVNITQEVFDQIARYNFVVKVPLLMVTNGLQHFCCRLNDKDDGWSFLQDIPTYSQMQTLM